jgi:hypothetical protein
VSSRRLTSCGVIGPLLFVVVFTIEGALRPGYRPRKHFVSSALAIRSRRLAIYDLGVRPT